MGNFSLNSSHWYARTANEKRIMELVKLGKYLHPALANIIPKFFDRIDLIGKKNEVKK